MRSRSQGASGALDPCRHQHGGTLAITQNLPAPTHHDHHHQRRVRAGTGSNYRRLPKRCTTAAATATATAACLLVLALSPVVLTVANAASGAAGMDGMGMGMSGRVGLQNLNNLLGTSASIRSASNPGPVDGGGQQWFTQSGGASRDRRQWEGPPDTGELQPCDGVGDPLQDGDNVTLNCGRGGVACPDGATCDVHPADQWAVCCPPADPAEQPAEQPEACAVLGNCDHRGNRPLPPARDQ